MRLGASNGFVDKTQEKPGVVCKDADNEVPSYVWKVTIQASDVKHVITLQVVGVQERHTAEWSGACRRRRGSLQRLREAAKAEVNVRDHA